MYYNISLVVGLLFYLLVIGTIVYKYRYAGNNEEKKDLIKTFIFFCYKTPVEIFVFDSRSKKFLNDLNDFYECLIVLNVLNVYVSPVGKIFVTKRIFKM